MAIVVLVALVVVLALGDRSTPGAARVETAGTPVVTPEATSSAAWYCAAGTSDPDGRSDQNILISNLADEELEARVTVLAGGDAAPGVGDVTVEPHATLDVALSDVLATSEPGVVVETFGGQALVEHQIRDGEDLAIGPCASDTASTWRFATGTTAQGAEQFLVLFNPHREDTSVDVSFVTETGLSQPERLQGLTVPRQSRVTVPVHDEIGRESLVATRVDARMGRIVAEQVLRFDGSDTVGGRSGMGLSLGATDTGGTWSFPWAGVPDAAGQGISVANFDTVTAELTISIALDGDATIEDQIVEVPPRTVSSIDLVGRVPAGIEASVTLEAEGDMEIVAEQLVASPEGGIATVVGATKRSSDWALARAGQRIALLNPGEEAVRVDVRTAGGEELASLEVPGRGRAEVRGEDLVSAGAGPVVIEATGPVIVVRVDGDVSVSGAVARG